MQRKEKEKVGDYLKKKVDPHISKNSADSVEKIRSIEASP